MECCIMHHFIWVFTVCQIPFLGVSSLQKVKESTQGYSVFRTCLLAQWISLSEILPWDRKSYLTHAILPRLSCESYIHWLYWNSRTWSSSDVIVMLKWRHHAKLHLSLFRDYWGLFWNLKKRWARKIIHYSCEGRIEKIVPQITVCHHSASLVMPKDDPRDWFFYPTLTLMKDSYNIL